MYETHLQQRRTTKLENKLSQRMLQHSRYEEKQNEKMRKLEKQKVLHGLIERPKIHNRV